MHINITTCAFKVYLRVVFLAGHSSHLGVAEEAFLGQKYCINIMTHLYGEQADSSLYKNEALIS